MKRNSLTLIVVILIINFHALAQINYGVPEGSWPEPFGNHRAVLEISKRAEVVGLDLLWRRHDHNPEDRRFIIVEATSGDTVSNIFRYEVNNEQCKIAFGPVEKTGTYFFYYLPYSPVYKKYVAGPYLKKEDKPDKEWVLNNRLTGDSTEFEKIYRCKVKEIQARTEFHSFFPMEVIATNSEVEMYLEQNDIPYLVFPEDRTRPIKMLNALPYLWLQSKPSNEFNGVAQRNEYYALQLGVFASENSLKNLKVEFSDLSNNKGETILSSSITCFNTHGVDIEGKPFTLQVNVDKGKVQPMWIGIDVPIDITPGRYRGYFTVSADNQAEKQIKIDLKIKDNILEDRGDGETWRHSRLRWLNSTIGIDEEPVKPYTAIKVKDKTISCLGRDVVLNEFGFPAEVNAWENEVLASPIKFTLESNNRVIQLKPNTFLFTKKENGIVAW